MSRPFAPTTSLALVWQRAIFWTMVPAVCALLGPVDNPASTDRLQGLSDVPGSHLADEAIFGTWEEGSGFAGVEQLMAEGWDFDALACGNDRIAVGAIRRLQSAGLEVPGAVLVIGFGDHPIATQTRPTVTSVHQPFHLHGVRTVEIAMDMLHGAPAVVQVLETGTVTRDSTRR